MTEPDVNKVLDIATYTKDKPWIENIYRDVSKLSVAKQTVVGGVSGWCAGMLFAKVGKVAAATVGTSLLLLQVAQHQGYVTVNWTKIEKSMQTAKDSIEKDSKLAYPHIAASIKTFFAQNVFLASGFAGGFLLGLSAS
ncbi:FUN14 domain-containing protein 1-like [Argonauta hians]